MTEEEQAALSTKSIILDRTRKNERYALVRIKEIIGREMKNGRGGRNDFFH